MRAKRAKQIRKSVIADMKANDPDGLKSGYARLRTGQVLANRFRTRYRWEKKVHAQKWRTP